MLRAAGRISQIRNMMSAARSMDEDGQVKVTSSTPSSIQTPTFESRMSDVEVDVGCIAVFKVVIADDSEVESYKWLREVSKSKRIELDKSDARFSISDHRSSTRHTINVVH